MALTEHLLEKLREATEGLPAISERRMFGCDGLFARGQIFGLIWKTGRIGLRLPEDAAFDELVALPGSDRWKPGNMTIAHWLLVPETFHDDDEALRAWAVRAHELALAAPAKAKKPKPAAKAGAGKKKPTRPAAKKAR